MQNKPFLCGWHLVSLPLLAHISSRGFFYRPQTEKSHPPSIDLILRRQFISSISKFSWDCELCIHVLPENVRLILSSLDCPPISPLLFSQSVWTLFHGASPKGQDRAPACVSWPTAFLRCGGTQRMLTDSFQFQLPKTCLFPMSMVSLSFFFPSKLKTGIFFSPVFLICASNRRQTSTITLLMQQSPLFFSSHWLQSKAQNYHWIGLGARCSPAFLHLLCAPERLFLMVCLFGQPWLWAWGKWEHLWGKSWDQQW